MLTMDGNLVLMDSDNTLVWSTDTSNMDVTEMQIHSTGNLVLINRLTEVVWQSFEHPSEAVLPGQEFVVGQRLTVPDATSTCCSLTAA